MFKSSGFRYAPLLALIIVGMARDSRAGDVSGSSILFFDDGEQGPAGWTLGGDATFAQTTSSFHSPSTAWTDSPFGNYPPSIQTDLRRMVDLSGVTSATLSFWHRYDLGSGGVVSVFVAPQGQGFQNLQNFTGSSPGWQQAIVDLTPFAGEVISLSFQLFSDGSGTGDGWYIDDVGVFAGLLPFAFANQPSFAPGQTLDVTVNVTNMGAPFSVDFFFGALLPDGDTIIYFTDLAFNAALGSLSDLTTLSPIVGGVNLSSPFNLYQPGFFSYTRGTQEPPGTYFLFLAAVMPGGFGDGSIDPGDLVGLSIWPIGFPP